MLWDLDSAMVGQYCRVWNTCVKLSYDIPRSTHTYLVEHLLAVDFVPVRTELLARYVNFHKALLKSKSSEVQFLAEIVTSDVRTTTSRNLALVQQVTGLDPSKVTSHKVREAVKVADVPVNDVWRLRLLQILIERR